MGNRPRITRKIIGVDPVIKPIKTLAEQFQVPYSAALRAYQRAKQYCNVFKDKTVLEETEYILLTYKQQTFRKFS